MFLITKIIQLNYFLQLKLYKTKLHIFHNSIILKQKILLSLSNYNNQNRLKKKIKL